MRKFLALITVLLAAMLLSPADSYAGSATRFSDSPPFWGGDAIWSPIGAASTTCTSGFSLYDGSGAGHNFELTADHCTAEFNNFAWYANSAQTVYMGQSGAENAGLDSMDIIQSSGVNNWGYVYADPNATYRKVYSWETTDQDVIGNTACIDGSQGRERCLTINGEHLHYTAGGPAEFVTARCPNGQNCTLDGDSGAPVYAICNHSPCVDEVEAMGTFVGSIYHCSANPCNATAPTFIYEDEVWMPIRYIMSWLHTFDSHMQVRCLVCSLP